MEINDRIQTQKGKVTDTRHLCYSSLTLNLFDIKLSPKQHQLRVCGQALGRRLGSLHISSCVQLLALLLELQPGLTVGLQQFLQADV